MNNIETRPALLLLVEDDQSMLDGMADLFQMPSLLQAMGIHYKIEVMTANNGQEALALMQKRQPDLIVSDIMMPVMDGYQFLSQVQKNPDWLHVPFIFLTAKGNKKEVLEGTLRGANLYITKPFASTELLELIKSQLDRAFQRQLSYQQNIGDLKKGILQILNHEFRTPLTYVTAYYEMLSESLNRAPENQDFREYLRGIQAGCVRLTRLIEDFILVIELRTGEYKTRFQRRAKLVTTINSLIETAVRNYTEEAAKRGIEFDLSLSQDLLPIYGDKQSLQIVFDRLVNNSVKFSPKQGDSTRQIHISSECDGETVLVTIRDEGIGFPPVIKEQVFDLFFQYNRGLMEQQGAGTGLTIAKGLVDLHNGRIQVTSQEGEGSTFTVMLPVFSGVFAQSTPGVIDPERKTATVLAVEDEANLLMGLKELLEIGGEKYDLNVLTAANGQQGLAVLKEHKPDLIISDIMMPEMDGFEFLKQVRQNPEWIQIPFIFLTAKGERHDIHRGLSSGAEIYITKPYDSDELLQLVTVQIDHYFQLQELANQNFDALKRGILQLITPDFRLPLSAVQTYSQALAADLENVRSDAELKHSLHGIHEGSVRLTMLVEDFISLAELKTGETETAYALREQPIYNPGVIFREVSQSYEDLANQKNVELHCDLDDNLPPIYGDAESLRNALQRLVEFAIKLDTSDMPQNLLLSASSIRNELVLQLDLPPTMGSERFDKLVTIMTKDDLESLEMSDYAPSLTIAKSYILLNNGRIQLNPDVNQIIISFPAYTPTEA